MDTRDSQDYIYHPVKGVISPTIDGIEYPATEWQNAIQFHCLTRDSDYGTDNYFKDIFIEADPNLEIKLI